MVAFFNNQINAQCVLTGDIKGTDASCGHCDGTTNLTVTGNQPPFSYNWTGPNGPFFTEDLANLCPGTYTVTVTDAVNCTWTGS